MMFNTYKKQRSEICYLKEKLNLREWPFAQGRSSFGFEEERVGQRPIGRPLAYVWSMILSLLWLNQELPSRYHFHHFSGQQQQGIGGSPCAGAADSGDRRWKVRRKPPVHNTQLVRPGMGQGCRLEQLQDKDPLCRSTETASRRPRSVCRTF